MRNRTNQISAELLLTETKLPDKKCELSHMLNTQKYITLEDTFYYQTIAHYLPQNKNNFFSYRRTKAL